MQFAFLFFEKDQEWKKPNLITQSARERLSEREIFIIKSFINTHDIAISHKKGQFASKTMKSLKIVEIRRWRKRNPCTARVHHALILFLLLYIHIRILCLGLDFLFISVFFFLFALLQIHIFFSGSFVSWTARFFRSSLASSTLSRFQIQFFFVKNSVFKWYFKEYKWKIKNNDHRDDMNIEHQRNSFVFFLSVFVLATVLVEL